MDARRRLARLLGHGSLSRVPQAPDERPLGEAAPRVEASERVERAGIEADGGAPGARGAAFEGERGAVADAVGTSGDEACVAAGLSGEASPLEVAKRHRIERLRTLIQGMSARRGLGEEALLAFDAGRGCASPTSATDAEASPGFPESARADLEAPSSTERAGARAAPSAARTAPELARATPERSASTRPVGLLGPAELLAAARPQVGSSPKDEAQGASSERASGAPPAMVVAEALTPYSRVPGSTRRDEAHLADVDGPETWRLGPRPVLPGAREQTEFGPLRRVAQVLEPHHCHGRVRVASALEASADRVAALALEPALGEVDLSRALFLDTETTGLSLGAGTVPFLIGLAGFDDQSLWVEQLLLEALGEEVAMLERVRARVEAASCLITYNGKSYDWPLLETRFVLNRLRPPPRRPHLDLLHVARRVFKRRLGGARLVQMEERVLGHHRERDIDGAEIPGLYWSFLRQPTAVALAPVIEHNANDVIALAALLGALAARYTHLHTEDDPRDHLGLAEVARRADDAPRALAFAWAAAEGGGAREDTVAAFLLAAELHRRRGEWAQAEAALLRALEASCGSEALAAPAQLALAKLLEHRLGDPVRALQHARGAAIAEGEAASARRLARLELKCARKSERDAQAASPAPPRASRRGARQARSAGTPTGAGPPASLDFSRAPSPDRPRPGAPLARPGAEGPSAEPPVS
jgi:uncharacterized protein YprB with RNaseH-like and TPR domain